MKNISRNKLIIGVGLIVILALLLILSLTRNYSSENPSLDQSTKTTITNTTTGEKIIINSDGLVEYSGNEGSKFFTWDDGKIKSLFDYLGNNVSSDLSGFFIEGFLNGYIGGGDELLNIIFDENSTSSTSPDLSNFFTPSPTSSSGSGTGGYGGSGSTPTLPPPAPSWCKHWKLSYCADFLYASPTPTPNTNGVIQASNCDEWSGKTDQKRTVISNTSCTK